MPRYFSDIKDSHRLIDPAGSECECDKEAVEKAKVLTIGVSLDKPEVDPTRHIAVMNSDQEKIPGCRFTPSRPPTWRSARASANDGLKRHPLYPSG
jgi:hypothetical protein